MFEVALLFERGYLCSSAVAYVVARCSRIMIVDVLPYKTSVESEGERETAAAQAAHRRGSTVGFEFEVGLFVVCLFVSLQRLLERALLLCASLSPVSSHIRFHRGARVCEASALRLMRR